MDPSPLPEPPVAAPMEARQVVRLFLLRTLLICFLLVAGSVALKVFLYLSSPHTHAVLRGEGRLVEYVIPFEEGPLLVQGRLTHASFRITWRKWGFFDLYVVIQGDAQSDAQGRRFGGASAGLAPSQTRQIRFR